MSEGALDQVRRQLQRHAEPERVEVLQRFFKTGPGEYGEGDRFIGVRVPAIRAVCRSAAKLPPAEVLSLLTSPVHEERLLALLILVCQYQRGTPREQQAIYRTYLAHTRHINNWDLVDASAEHIVGRHLWERSRRPLRKLAASKHLWERRIALMATFHFIKRNDFGETLQLVELLLTDGEDLIHKAAGWMLREIGRREVATLRDFLQRHYRSMPRTMLRYAIEKFPERERRAYLTGKK